MRNIDKDILRLAQRYGYVLIRQAKHLVFKHSNGAVLVTSKSTSDCRALRNIEGTIKKQLKLDTPSIDF